MDINGNGTIDDGSEMFGNMTPQPPPDSGEARNGFRTLALLDDNLDGVVDDIDAAFEHLRLWQDRNHDGFSQTSELYALPQLGVAGISVNYYPSNVLDEHGNNFRYAAQVVSTADSIVGMTAYDVWLTGVKQQSAFSKLPQDPDPCGSGGGNCELPLGHCWVYAVGGDEKCSNGGFSPGYSGYRGMVTNTTPPQCAKSGQTTRSCALTTVQCCPYDDWDLDGCYVANEP
jgi:hypothetical protein